MIEPESLSFLITYSPSPLLSLTQNLAFSMISISDVGLHTLLIILSLLEILVLASGWAGATTD